MNVEEKISELQEEVDRYNEIANKYLRESMSTSGQESEYNSVKEERYRAKAKEIKDELDELRRRLR